METLIIIKVCARFKSYIQQSFTHRVRIFIALSNHISHIQQISSNFYQFTLFSISFSLTFIITTYLLTPSVLSCLFLLSVNTYPCVCLYPFIYLSLSRFFVFIHVPYPSLSFCYSLFACCGIFPNRPPQSPPRQGPSPHNAYPFSQLHFLSTRPSTRDSV